MIIAAMDPGKVTGVCLVEFLDVRHRLDALIAKDCAVISSAELGFGEVLDWCEKAVPGTDKVAAEKFIITPQTGKNSQAPWSLMALGVLTAICMRHDANLTLQTPVDAKSLVSNDLLRVLSLWHRGGAGHANDALRHAVLCAIRAGWRSPALVAKP